MHRYFMCLYCLAHQTNCRHSHAIKLNFQGCNKLYHLCATNNPPYHQLVLLQQSPPQGEALALLSVEKAVE